MPSAVLNSHQGESAITAAAADPGPAPASRAASANAPASASSPPARATISHSAGAAPPNRASGVVNSTGNGFHDGPVVVSSASRPTSRPQTDHASGSNASAHGRSSESAATTTRGQTTAAAALKASLAARGRRARRPSRRSGRTRSSATDQSATGFGREDGHAVGGAGPRARRAARALRRRGGPRGSRRGSSGPHRRSCRWLCERRSSADSARSDLELAPQRARWRRARAPGRACTRSTIRRDASSARRRGPRC